MPRRITVYPNDDNDEGSETFDFDNVRDLSTIELRFERLSNGQVERTLREMSIKVGKEAT